LRYDPKIFFNLDAKHRGIKPFEIKKMIEDEGIDKFYKPYDQLLEENEK
tara:strand:+ start:19480 stop:19626 length:147 start_codon:yes stop_codon:yes gene_type:complete